jgi:hypothetical protein
MTNFTGRKINITAGKFKGQTGDCYATINGTELVVFLTKTQITPILVKTTQAELA